MPAPFNVVTLGILSVTKSIATIGLLNDLMNRVDNKFRVRLVVAGESDLTIIDGGVTVCANPADIHNIQINNT